MNVSILGRGRYYDKNCDLEGGDGDGCWEKRKINSMKNQKGKGIGENCMKDRVKCLKFAINSF